MTNGPAVIIEAAALQLSPRFGDVEGNRADLARAVRSLEVDVDLIVAPELANTGYDLEGFQAQAETLAEHVDGPTVTLVRELAAERAATIVLGFLERADDGALYDAAVVADPSARVDCYRKTHLYPPERDHFRAGDRLVPLSSGAVRLGVMICFEHAFPEIATTLALRGAQVLAIPSAVPRDYEHLLRLRSQARAQDNQVFVVAANLAGGVFCGGSMIVDPRGEVLAEAGTGSAVIRATLDLTSIEDERAREPVLRLRRPELYE